jgi:hypothetical protein
MGGMQTPLSVFLTRDFVLLKTIYNCRLFLIQVNKYLSYIIDIDRYNFAIYR